MSQVKMLRLTSCSFCPSFTELDGERFCTAVGEFLKREDVFILENGEAVENKFPEWCPLEDC